MTSRRVRALLVAAGLLSAVALGALAQAQQPVAPRADLNSQLRTSALAPWVFPDAKERFRKTPRQQEPFSVSSGRYETGAPFEQVWDFYAKKVGPTLPEQTPDQGPYEFGGVHVVNGAVDHVKAINGVSRNGVQTANFLHKQGEQVTSINLFRSAEEGKTIITVQVVGR